jgi:glyoxalase family protein
MAEPLITGVHHVTALAGDPRENHAFYTEVLGLRLVKRTVNFDDPTTYHLYFGDRVGSPGTLLTHFPHPHARPGVHGSPEIRETLLRAPMGSFGYWGERLAKFGVAARVVDASGGPRLAFEDPHGMRFALTESDAAAGVDVYTDGGVDAVHAIMGIEGATIFVPSVDETAGFLSDVLGFTVEAADERGARLRLLDGPGQRLELAPPDGDGGSRLGAGVVHHIAWRVPSDAAQAELAERLVAAGLNVTPQQDRQYFRSIYFRIPGGVIFEVATDGPGFDVDEPVDALGESIKLPPQYEPRREEIENGLVRL